MKNKEMEVFLIRWQHVIKRIGHARLLALPRQIKDELAGTTNLVRKTLLLEEIEKILR